MIVAGIDAGSRSIKIVVLDEKGEIVAQGLTDQGVRQRELARDLYRETLDRAGIDEGRVGSVVATGYGRDALDFSETTITEISCHARGVRHVFSDARTVIDIGGQDSKLIRLDDRGRVFDFVMNDRCAAGTGRFLEIASRILETDLEGLGRLAEPSKKPSRISNMCVVFAETEIIGLLASGAPPTDIAAGVLDSLFSRIASMAGRRLTSPVVFTGGVARIPGMAERLGRTLGTSVRVPDSAQMTGALGAALLALQSRSGTSLSLDSEDVHLIDQG